MAGRVDPVTTLMEFGLLAAALVSFGLAFVVLRATEPEDEVRNRFDVLLGAGLVGLAVGRLVAMLRAGTNPLEHPLDLLVVRGGVDTVAAAVTACAAAAFMSRQTLWRGLDAIAPATAAALTAWHGGCLIRDTCLGTPTTLPWGVSAGPGGAPRHPVEIYTALLLAIALGLLVLLRRQSARIPGAAAAGGFTLVATARLATEPMRPVLGAGLAVWYLVGLLIGLVVLAWRFSVRPRPG